jgi:hypothetical protein
MLKTWFAKIKVTTNFKEYSKKSIPSKDVSEQIYFSLRKDFIQKKILTLNDWEKFSNEQKKQYLIEIQQLLDERAELIDSGMPQLDLKLIYKEFHGNWMITRRFMQMNY